MFFFKRAFLLEQHFSDSFYLKKMALIFSKNDKKHLSKEIRISKKNSVNIYVFQHEKEYIIG